MTEITMECNCTPKGLLGNSAPQRCATPGCNGTSHGSHYPCCIGNFCWQCQEKIKREKVRKERRRSLLNRYKKKTMIHRGYHE